MLVSTVNQYLPRRLALRGATLLGSRAFSLTAPTFKTEAPVKSRAGKAEPPKKILKKDLKPPYEFPGTSWTNFIRELRSEETNNSFVETMQFASFKWGEMSQAEKDEYAPPREELEEYYANKKAWIKTLPRNMRPKKKAGQSSAYPLFVKDFYDRSLSFQDNSRALKAKWDSLSEAEKQTYSQRAKEMNAARRSGSN